MRAIPERLRDASSGGAIQINYLYLFLPLPHSGDDCIANYGGAAGMESQLACRFTSSHIADPKRPYVYKRYFLNIYYS